MTFAQTLASEAAEHTVELPFDAMYFGIIALVVFMLLLGITWSFRNTAMKVVEARTAAAHGADHGASAVHEHR